MGYVIKITKPFLAEGLYLPHPPLPTFGSGDQRLLHNNNITYTHTHTRIHPHTLRNSRNPSIAGKSLMPPDVLMCGILNARPL